jgi:hypothetical protein
MINKNFTTGEVERVSFDSSSRYLEIHWRNKRIETKLDGEVQCISWKTTRLPAKRSGVPRRV